jgi:uncharacterized protein (TIGR00255 family)
MIFSMTGFAAQEHQTETATLMLELRAVNSRYLDLHFKLDDAFQAFELPIRERIGKHLNRGKVECKLSLVQRTKSQQNMLLDTDVLKQLADLQQDALAIFPHSATLSIAEILRWPGAIVTEDGTQDMTQDVMDLVELGLAALNASRAREGEKLKALIEDRIKQIGDLVLQVKPLLPALAKSYQLKLEAKLHETLKTIDQERIAQELVMFAQRIDVDEELTRLSAHITEVQRILNSKDPAGKRLDFLMQELNREANTLGSKSVSIETTQVSMQLKVLIEQMREQIQNIE